MQLKIISFGVFSIVSNLKSKPNTQKSQIRKLVLEIENKPLWCFQMSDFIGVERKIRIKIWPHWNCTGMSSSDAHLLRITSTQKKSARTSVEITQNAARIGAKEKNS